MMHCRRTDRPVHPEFTILKMKKVMYIFYYYFNSIIKRKIVSIYNKRVMSKKCLP